MNRIHAAVKQCSRRGGGCDCGESFVGCRALALVESKLADLCKQEAVLNQEKQKLWDHRERLKSPLAPIREGWKRPESPEGYELIAVLDGGEWQLYFASKEDEEDLLDGPIGDEAWPFSTETAYSEDWEAIGVRTDIA